MNMGWNNVATYILQLRTFLLRFGPSLISHVWGHSNYCEHINMILIDNKHGSDKKIVLRSLS